MAATPQHTDPAAAAPAEPTIADLRAELAKKDEEIARLKAPYQPPEVWSPPDPATLGRFAGTNSHTAGAREETELPKGEHPYQLYSLGTPNGIKVTILLEELGVEYDAWLLSIGGAQFGSGFVAINPNSKIPAMVDRSGEKEIRIFESCAIMIHLAEKHGKFLPPVGDPKRAEVMSWVMWQMGSAPFLGGGFGHFYHYAPVKIEYAINRYAMETKRQLDVLDKQLAKTQYVAGDEYTIADMAIFPWYGSTVLGRMYESKEFLQVEQYKNVLRWANMLMERPAVKRGRMVNRAWGPDDEKVPERHSAKDFEGKKGL